MSRYYHYIQIGLLLSGFIVACNCKKNPVSSDPVKAQEQEGEAIKTSSQKPFDWSNLQKGDLFVGKGWIDATDNWLAKLGVDKTKDETVIVNASNENIKSPGGGIDGALASWAVKNGITPWTNPAPLLSNGAAVTGNLQAGQFGYIKGSFGYVYLAVGPRASGVVTLEQTLELVKSLYQALLVQAQNHNMKTIILPAISTAIFASPGKESKTGKAFTKEEFIYHIYRGMFEAIEAFRTTYPAHKLKIILNNWDVSYTPGVTVI